MNKPGRPLGSEGLVESPESALVRPLKHGKPGTIGHRKYGVSRIAAGKDNIDIAWWLSLYPGLAILITVLGYNLLGEGIRDSLDPRLR